MGRIITAPGVTQSELNRLAKDISISVTVVDNLKNSAVSYTFKLELHNTGLILVPSAGWKLFFYSTFLLFPSVFPKSLSTVLPIEKVRISMHGGNLFSLEPDVTFKSIAPGETRTIELEAAFWSVSRTDFMPNWYFVSTVPGLEPKIAKSTESNLDFVKPFEDVRQLKRYNFDRYNPFTPQERLTRLQVTDMGTIGKPLIPTPAHMRIKIGGRKLSISASWKVRIMSMVSIRGSLVAENTARRLGLKLHGGANQSEAEIINMFDNTLETRKEGYGIRVDHVKSVVEISSKDAAGLFYGAQSLLSLMKTFPDGLPEVDIHDWPRFEYRGMHVDVARNFLTVGDLKRLMDGMAMYKMNKLHLHLTDDEGWRVEIPDIPELTEVGSKRCHDLSERKCLLPQWGSGPTTKSSGSGFYTNQQYKNILDYAYKNFIEVIPEIDLPGHAHAAIKSMEWRYISRTNRTEAEEFRLIDPDDTSFYTSVQNWMDNAINPCIETTYKFIARVIDTFIEFHKAIPLALRTFHFGGDLVANGAWVNSTKCREFLTLNPKYNIPNGLKKYFLERIATLTAERGLGMSGWEDAFMGDNDDPFPIDQLPNRDITAYAWNNIWEWGAFKRAYKLANAGYKVVMAQATHLYFDHPYEPDPEERGLYWAARFTDTKKTFGFLPDSLYDNIDVKRSGEPLTQEDVCGKDFSKCEPLHKPENIIGMQGQLWSETVRGDPGRLPPQNENFDDMVFPRLLALAERAWHKSDFEEEGIIKEERRRREKLDWTKFANTLGYKELDRLYGQGLYGYNGKRSFRIPPPGARVSHGKVEFSVTFPGLAVEYSRDNGITWNKVVPGSDVVWGNQTVMLLRTRSGDRYSRVVELLEDEPPRQADQDTIDYIASNLEITAGVVDNLNKIQNEYVTLQLKLYNKGSSTIRCGTWKIYFHNIHGVKEERLDCGLEVTHVNGDLYYLSFFVDPEPGHQIICTLHQKFWNAARSDFFPNWYVSSEGLIPKVIENTKETREYVMPYDTQEKWKRAREDRYNPYTVEDRYVRNQMSDNGNINRLIPVLPTPYYVKTKDDENRISLDGWVIMETPEFPKEALFLADKLQLPTATQSPPRWYIQLLRTILPENSKEAYHLTIKPRSITIEAQDNSGAFYAAQSLISLWESGAGTIPILQIQDKPRFDYRGVMIDTARNFKPKEWIYKILDTMAVYKLNRLHLRLSDDEAWRLEIPGIPELTEMGSNRCQNHDRDSCLIPQSGSGPDKSLPGSGFYKVQDYRDILQYATDRHITVIPEISMPDHSKAAITSMEYRNDNFKNLISRGEDVSHMRSYTLSDPDDIQEVKTKGGWKKNTMNPCMGSTYDFINKVLDELILMHKGINDLKVFHMGGDNVPAGSWEKSPECEHILPTIGSGTSFLREYFIKTVSDLVAGKGLDLATWEDGVYTDDKLDPIADFKSSNVYTYAWKNIWETGKAKRSAELADGGYKVILAMATHLFLCATHEPDPEEIGLYGTTRFTDTKKIFGFLPDDIFANADVSYMGEPINITELCRKHTCPVTVSPQNIIGMQASMFSKLVRTEEELHHALFPRLLALAERAWHKAPWENIQEQRKREKMMTKDWNQFVSKLGYYELPRLEKKSIFYRLPPPGGRTYGNILRVNTQYPNLGVELSIDKGKTWYTVGTHTFLWRRAPELWLRTRSKYTNRLSRTVILPMFGWIPDSYRNWDDVRSELASDIRQPASNTRDQGFPFWRWPFVDMAQHYSATANQPSKTGFNKTI